MALSLSLSLSCASCQPSERVSPQLRIAAGHCVFSTCPANGLHDDCVCCCFCGVGDVLPVGVGCIDGVREASDGESDRKKCQEISCRLLSPDYL